MTASTTEDGAEAPDGTRVVALPRPHDFDASLPEARVVLAGVPGCGPWTVGMTAGFALGDPDAVPVGDLHLPSLVANVLVGEAEADDARMLDLLEPYRGHRFRLIRLLLAADRIRLGRCGRA